MLNEIYVVCMTKLSLFHVSLDYFIKRNRGGYFETGGGEGSFETDSDYKGGMLNRGWG